MTTPKHAAPSTGFVDRFLTVVRPPRAAGEHRREPRQIEGPAFASMIWRILRALEARTIDDPELLPQCVALAQRLDELVNVAIAANAERYAADPRSGASAGECGRILGISKQAASKRRERGAAIIAARIESAGRTHINLKTGRKVSGETARELAAIEAAAEHAVTYLAEWRERKAS